MTSSGGHAKTLMFVQINPDASSYSETLSTLKFAERVSEVELGAAKANKEGKDIRELMEQVKVFLLISFLSIAEQLTWITKVYFIYPTIFPLHRIIMKQ
jgi:hypothetical protein